MKVIICLFILLLVDLSYGEIYQWKDSGGRTHFSDKPPKEELTAINQLAVEVDSSLEKSLFNQLKTEEGERVLKSVANGNFYQYIPRGISKAFAVVVVNHGMFSRDESAKESAYNTSRRWQRFSEKTGAIIIAPVFDNYSYAVTSEGPQKWGYRGLFGRKQGADMFLNDVISYYQRANSFYDGKIFLSGHSAGAQFANRYLVRHPNKVHAAAFSAPAWFSLPTYQFPWPNGMKQRYRVIRWPGELTDKIIDIRPDPKGWLKASQLPVTVIVGENDLEKIRHVDGVGGDTHVDRAVYWVESMNKYANKNGLEGHVKLKIVTDVGHNFGKLAAECQYAMKRQIESHLINENIRINAHTE
ncbi:MAG: DUF4124 domain-containing protein [Oleispira sp.]|nr:DUF4124 domain-containing protein [Oleispira sp.]MBL4881122.1 DUF4124 domain-containing protein [Oleispira sp.]